MLSGTTAQHIYFINTVQNLYSKFEINLQELHRICSYIFTCTKAQHIYFTTHYIFYIAQMNCTYNIYTESAATYSPAHQQNTLNVQILYKLYIVTLNYS